MPKWAVMLCSKFDAMCESLKGGPNKQSELSAPGVALELFSAIKVQVDELKEENRKLTALVDKEGVKPENAQTFAVKEEKVNEDTKTSLNLARQGKNLYMRRDA